jgi:hypothetical protein
LNDIGGFRPDLTQPSRIVLRGNLAETDSEDILSMTENKVWESGLT